MNTLNTLPLVIAGARYFNGDSILIPHFTGEFYMVDCDEYAPLKTLKAIYSKDYVTQVVEDERYLEHDGVKYYCAESGPFIINDWELLSDLSSLRFTAV